MWGLPRRSRMHLFFFLAGDSGFGDYLTFVQSILAGKKLVMRRLRFCNSKINSLQSELNEALQLNMSGVTCDV